MKPKPPLVIHPKLLELALDDVTVHRMRINVETGTPYVMALEMCILDLVKEKTVISAKLNAAMARLPTTEDIKAVIET